MCTSVTNKHTEIVLTQQNIQSNYRNYNQFFTKIFILYRLNHESIDIYFNYMFNLLTILHKHFRKYSIISNDNEIITKLSEITNKTIQTVCLSLHLRYETIIKTCSLHVKEN